MIGRSPAPPAGTPTLLGFRGDAVKLWAAALLVATALCGAEVNYFGRRDVVSMDQMNNLVLTASMAEGLLDGFLPPRVSPMLSDGAGNPFHQFYSPLAHLCSAVFSLLLGDAVTGFSFFTVFVLALAFVCAYRLGRFLTLSGVCAAVLAFLFVTAPYFSTDRVLRGAFPEYAAFCLLPAALYYNLRALPLRRFRYWALAVAATAALILTHLITGFFFLFFYAVFLLLAGAFHVSRYLIWRKAVRDGHTRNGGGEGPEAVGRKGPRLRPRPCPRPGRLAMKGLAAASVAAGAVLLAMFMLGPALLYDDLAMKTSLRQGTAADSGFMTPVLSLFSLNDTSWNRASGLTIHPRFQAGLLLLTSYAAFLYFLARRSAAWATPFALTAGLVLLAVARPYVFLFPPLSWVDIVQFSYRLLSLFTLCGAVSGALAMRALFRSVPGFGPGARLAAAMAAIALSLALAAPYLAPGAPKGREGVNVDTAELYRRSRLDYGEGAYLRNPPASDGAVWTDPGRRAAGWGGRPGDWRFSVDLEDYFRTSGGPTGEVLLDVLHYPGLQRIEILLDGKSSDLAAGTFWQRREPFAHLADTGRAAFHGLKLSGAPSAGRLEVRVRFTGYGWANWTSLAMLALLLALSVRAAVRGCPAGKSQAIRSGD